MNDSGWIKLHRSILDHKLYPRHRMFTKFEAWLDILLTVNYKDRDYVPAGSCFVSYRALAKRWKWSVHKVQDFLGELEHLQMTVRNRVQNGYKEGYKKGTLLTVANWELYQCGGYGKDTEKIRKRYGKDTENENLLYSLEERKKERNKKDDTIPFPEIINYLNDKAGTNYRASSRETQKYIIARWNADFTLDDFKTVIDKKVATWKGDPEMAQYLRPSTLFGTKFEQYLNELEAKPQQPPKPKLRPGETEYQIYDPRNDSLLKWTPD
jgi:uncharacterized phage protein (TIGR02220 family)